MRLYWNTDAEAWDALVRLCPGVTAFHRGAWLEAVASARGARFEGAICELGSDRLAFVPLLTRARFGGLTSSANSGAEPGFLAYGGLLSLTPLSAAQIMAVYAAIAAKLPTLALRGNPYAPGPHLPGGGFAASTYEAIAVDARTLPLGPALWPGLEALWIPGPREFHADLIGGLEPRGSSRPRAFYYHYFRLAEAHETALLLLRMGDEPVAGVLLAFCDGVAYNLGLYARDQSRDLLMLLLAQLPEHLPRGITRLDLGVGVPRSALPPQWPIERQLVGARRHLPAYARLLRQEAL